MGVLDSFTQIVGNNQDEGTMLLILALVVGATDDKSLVVVIEERETASLQVSLTQREASPPLVFLFSSLPSSLVLCIVDSLHFYSFPHNSYLIYWLPLYCQTNDDSCSIC